MAAIARDRAAVRPLKSFKKQWDTNTKKPNEIREEIVTHHGVSY
jgi:hypothetical protein